MEHHVSGWRAFVFAAAMAAGMAASSAANAVTLSFQNVTTSDGGLISGTFDYVAGVVSLVDITTTSGDHVTKVTSYAAGTAISASQINFSGTAHPAGTALLSILLADGATFDDLEDGSIASATIAPSAMPFFSPSNEFISATTGTQLRGISGGFVQVTPIPSPAGALMVVSALGLAAAGRFSTKGRADG